MCLEKAIPREEEIEGKDNVYVTRDEMRSKVSLPCEHIHRAFELFGCSDTPRITGTGHPRDQFRII